MNALRDQILSGVSFAELAGQYSMDPENAAEGGLLGDFTAEDLPDLFKDAILATPVGTVTEVLKMRTYCISLSGIRKCRSGFIPLMK